MRDEAPNTGIPSRFLKAYPRGDCSPQVTEAFVHDPRVQRFIDALVHEGLHVRDAAIKAGLKVKRAKLLMQHPMVRQGLAAAMEVLRENERPRNIHAAITIRDRGVEEGASAAQQTVSLQAARYIDGSEEGGRVTVNVRAGGYLVDLSEPEEPPTIEAERVVVDFVRIGQGAVGARRDASDE